MNPNENINGSKKRRRNMFVASSRESLDVAQAVRNHFLPDFDVDLWNEGTFQVNQNTLESLLNLSAFYDFVIAIFSKDDQAQIRDQAVHVTRDNVIFEFGLFLGRLGPSRAFFIAEEGVDIFSDWRGVTTVSFARRDNLLAAVGPACNEIREEMQIADRIYTFSMLPSTALAMAYYHNFLSRILASVQESQKFEVFERDKDGNIDEKSRKIIRTNRRRFVVNVELPRNLGDLEPSTLRNRTSTYTQIVLKTPYRTYPFYINSQKDLSIDDGQLDLFDVPTIMLASKKAIDRIFDERFLVRQNRRQLIEGREIENFENILRLLIEDKAENDHFRFRVWSGNDNA